MTGSRHRLVLALALLVAALAGTARAQEEDPIAAIRAEARRLVDDGRTHQALVLLRAVEERTLPPRRVLELKAWIAELEAASARRLEDDLAAARELSEAGRHDEALARLREVPRYGSPDAVARAEAAAKDVERARGRAVEEAARAKADADRQRAAEARERAARREQEAAAAAEFVEAWVKKRRQLDCSTCGGDGRVRCGTCSGQGRMRVIQPSGGQSWVACPRCAGKGLKGCRACDGLGFNQSRFDDVLYDAFSPATRKKLGKEREFVDALGALKAGRPSDDPAARAVFARFAFALDAVEKLEVLDVTLAEGEDLARASVRLVVQVGAQAREERLAIERDADGWFLAPPPLPDPGRPDGGEGVR